MRKNAIKKITFIVAMCAVVTMAGCGKSEAPVPDNSSENVGTTEAAKDTLNGNAEGVKTDDTAKGTSEVNSSEASVAMGMEYLYIDKIVSNDPDNYIVEAEVLVYDETKFIEDAFSLSGRREQYVVAKDAVLKMWTAEYDMAASKTITYDINMQEFFEGGELHDYMDTWHMKYAELVHLFGEAHIQDGKLVEFIQYYEE